MPASERLRSALADRYIIERELGSGGMATVYLARDLKHDREVALKVLRADLSAVIGTERFLSEVRIAAKLDHPHILTLIDSGSADGILYYVLPYVRGESLRAKLDREKQLSVQDALSITSQVASALDYAHAQGVVHRDIKPENILLHEGEAVLADFGIALAVKAAGGNRLTETGLSLGTPLYMSPEQATGDRSLDRRSDVYSLGAVFYEMIAAEPPLTGPSAQAIIAKLLTEKPVKLRVVRETITPAMEQATEKALAKTPADRFGSAGEFARALAVAAPEQAGPGRATPSSRSRIIVAAIGVAALALIGLGLWLARGKFNAPAGTAVTLRDRRQITNTGRVSLPDMSDDGKVIAYVVTDCGALGCRYGIQMQDIDGGSSRRLLEGATSIQWLQVSPDRRNILFGGAINRVSGLFLVSTLGGPPRQLVNVAHADFWAGGDSLLLFRGSAFIAADTLWTLFSGLDGVPADSIRLDARAAAVANYTVVPNSQRIIYQLTSKGGDEWISADRSGKRYWSMRLPRLRSTGWLYASSDAIWIGDGSPTADGAIIRIPFDATTGRLAERGDTVYTGRFSAFSVTADGGTLLLDEGTTEFAGWSLSFDDLLKGKFTEDKRVLRATRPFGLNISPDGGAMVLWRDAESGNQTGHQISVMPFGGGAEIAIPGRHQVAGFVDSTTLAIVDKTALSLLDYRTQRRSGVLALPDSKSSLESPWAIPSYSIPLNITRLRGTTTGWAWIPTGFRTIDVQRDGATLPRKIRLPPWYGGVRELNASQDGGTIAFGGYNPSGDSIGIGLLSMSDGNFTHVWATVGLFARLMWLQDGSLLISIFDTPESVTLYRARIGGVVERVGSVPRPVTAVAVSADLRRAVVTTRDYRGDAWLSKVVR